MKLFAAEAVSQRLISRPLALEAVRAALIAATDGKANSFPSVTGFGPDADHRFSVKSATAGGSAPLTGLKVGSYWTSNASRGLPRHNSLVLLFDEAVGRIHAVIEAGVVNAFRTAAADALAVDLLARNGASVLALFGAGHQAFYEVMAIRDVRPSITRVLVANRDEAAAERLVGRLGAEGIVAAVATAEVACGAADVIVTATASRAPLFQADWVRHGAHVSAMGADGRGKQEIPVALLRRARLFADLPTQSMEIGEFQHVAGEIASHVLAPPIPLGDVLRGVAPGRTADDQVTVFDSSGIALQDLFVASRILDRAVSDGVAHVVA